MHRIETMIKNGYVDSLAENTLRSVKSHFSSENIKLDFVRTVRGYTIHSSLSEEQLELLGKELFSDPIVENYSIDNPFAGSNDFKEFEWFIEVRFKPGVTDNIGNTATTIANDIIGKDIIGKELGRNILVSSSIQYLLKGDLTKKHAEKIAKELLGNELIENFIIDKIDKFKNKDIRNSVLSLLLPKDLSFKDSSKIEYINLDISDEDLINLSKDRCLALTLEEMKSIKNYFSDTNVIMQRKKIGLAGITDAELELLAQTWSEHCKHKIFNAEIDYQEIDYQEITVDGNGNSKTLKSEKINSLFKTFIKGATEAINKDWLVSVFYDNAGVIKFDDEFDLVFKVETHNSPSALDPYGGALTGIVGCNRDPMGTGKGSRLIANTNVFCFADPYYQGVLPERIMHPLRIFEGVRKGVEHGGNKLGIPTVNGSIVFDNRYMGKPLVYCGTIGIMPHKFNGQKMFEKNCENGDLIVLVGGKTGKDGIHGATFSSEELHESSPLTAVQIGDPITQKKMMDFLLEARDLLMIKSITDDGAGGLASSVGEMALSSNGAFLKLDKVPLKYKGMNPWEILLSESQERMTVAVSKDRISEFLNLANDRDVEATVIGEFNNSGKFYAFHNNKAVAYVDLKFLHEGVPKLILEAVWKVKSERKSEREIKDVKQDARQDAKYQDNISEDQSLIEDQISIEVQDYNQELKNLLSRLNICSKEYVVRQYDHEVQGASVIKPLMGKKNDGPSDSAVIRPIEIARKNSWIGVGISNAIIPRYSDIDTYDMAACCIDESIRNLVSSGVNPEYIALLDNFCWPDPVFDELKTPDGKHKLAQLVRANKALYDYAVKFRTPFISGKDSMKNDYKIKGTKISVPPTLLISAIGKVDDVRNCITIDAKNSGDHVYVVGITKAELGGSEFYAMHNIVGSRVPEVDAESAMRIFKAIHRAISKGLVNSCHDCSDGGIAVALAETAFSGSLGMKIDLEKIPVEDSIRQENVKENAAIYKILFSESQSRFVITVSPDNAESFEKILREERAEKQVKETKEKTEISFARIGIVQESDFVITTTMKKYYLNFDKQIINIHWEELKDAWQKTLRW